MDKILNKLMQSQSYKMVENVLSNMMKANVHNSN